MIAHLQAPLLTLAAAVAGGAAAAFAGLPLGWLLGALGACALLAMNGISLRPPPLSREVGQSIIGLGIGLKTTATALTAVAVQAPAIAFSFFYIVLLAMAAAFWLAWWTGIDRVTAFYATSAAGVAEMALLAAERKGDPAAVALVQALRVSVIVLVVPTLLFLSGVDGGLSSVVEGAPAHPAHLVGVAAFAAAAGLLFRRLRLIPNPWLFGPMTVGATVALGVGMTISLPGWFLVVAQVLLGALLGCRFTRSMMSGAGRVLVGGLAIALAMIVFSALGAVVVSRMTSLSFANALLAVAPAGIAEMALTAKVLHLDPFAVTAFHMPRIILVNACIDLLAATYGKLGDRFTVVADATSRRNTE